MSPLAQQLLADRAARDAAKNQFNDHYQNFKTDIEERGLGGRVADEALEQAKMVFDEAVAIIDKNPAVVGGTLAALIVWLARNPLIAWISDIFGWDIEAGKDA